MIVPELYVTDLDNSLAFYRDLLGFKVAYARPAERFAYLRRGAAELMLEEPIGRTWLLAPMERPYGRGINLQIAAADKAALHARVAAAGPPIIQPLETRSYAHADDVVRQRQFVVADPDGYLLRFQQRLSPED